MIKHFILGGLLFAATIGEAKSLSAQSLFNRCYVQLTGRPVPLGHALMTEVRAGTLSPLDACAKILAKAQLGSTGSLVTDDPEARAVLENFYNFHRTWFSTNNLDNIGGYNSSQLNGTVDLYDATEPALHLTYTLFGPNQRYSDNLTRPVGVTAIRSEDPAVVARMGWKVSYPGRMLGNTTDAAAAPFLFRTLDPKLNAAPNDLQTTISILKSLPTLAVGDLVGIRPTTDALNVPNVSLLPLGDATKDNGSRIPSLNFSYDLHQNLGGGIMGTPIYLMQNLGHPMNTKFNGQTKLARRWSQQNMKSFLCANLPALRASDAAAFVVPTSTAPFRNSTSCVMCHATLDQMAYTVRHVTTGATDFRRITQIGVATRAADGTLIPPPAAFTRNAMAITTYQSTKPSVSGWPSEPVTDFHLQTPSGRLYFRSLMGNIVDVPVNDLAGLGRAMADTDDYYLCAAKRYFEFMTGVSVPLYDRSDSRNANLNAQMSVTDVKNRSYVESLGKRLRQTGSVSDLLQQIMASGYFQNENHESGDEE